MIIGNNPATTPWPVRAAAFPNLRADEAPLKDEVQLGPAPPLPVPAAPETKAEQGRSTALRAAAGVGLALVLAGVLSGCTGGGETPKPPDPPGQTTTVPTTLSSRVQQLVQEGKQTEARQMMSNGFYFQTLTRLANSSEPGVAEWARKGLAEYKVDGDPARMNQALEAALQQIAGDENAPGAARRFQEVARSALAVGDALEATQVGPAGILDQLKAEGTKAALEQVLTLPARVDQNADPRVPKEVVKAYLDTLTDLAQIALDTGADLGEPGLQATVYQATLLQIKTQIQTDGQFLGSEVQKLLEVIGSLQRLSGK